MKVTFKLLPGFINEYKCKEWEVYKDNVKTFFTIEKCSKEYYNYLFQDDSTYKKRSKKLYKRNFKSKGGKQK